MFVCIKINQILRYYNNKNNNNYKNNKLNKIQYNKEQISHWNNLISSYNDAFGWYNEWPSLLTTQEP